MKIAFIIGHNEKNKGFYSPHLKISEWDFYNGISCELEEIGDVFLHDPTINSYTNRCKDISERIGNNYDLTIALHFNSFNTTVSGTECFYWHNNEATKEIAEYLSSEYSKKVNSNNRGAKGFDSLADRGAGEVYYPKTNAILFEPFFGDNKEDCEKWNQRVFLQIMLKIELGYID